MVYHYLLWATGVDRPGIVAAVTQALYENGGNIEDSTMLRLGGEFAVLLIFSSSQKFSAAKMNGFLRRAEKKFRLTVGVKALTIAQAKFRAANDETFIVSLRGADRPGLVYKLTSVLAKRHFNITDLITHRTAKGSRPGYILFVEGELRRASLSRLQRDLGALARRLSTEISIRPLENNSI